MISKKMATALNDQIKNEIFSAYLYLSMSAYSNNIGLKGFANWFMVQYHEEMDHAMRMYAYLQDQGERVILQAIAAPPTEFESAMDMFQKTLVHEQKVTKSIHKLADLAVEEKDYATQIFLQWFVTEQIEEEANDNEIIDRLKMVGDKGNGLFMIDKELGRRVFKASTASE